MCELLSQNCDKNYFILGTFCVGNVFDCKMVAFCMGPLLFTNLVINIKQNRRHNNPIPILSLSINKISFSGD